MYDEKTLQKVLILLTENPDGRTEAYEYTVNWIKNQLADKADHYGTTQRWETYR